jgi:hypothetical protein
MYKYTILLLALLLPLESQAHTINYELADISTSNIAWVYLKLGYTHILPLGFDHVLFVFSLFLLSRRLTTVLWQATAFTVAHSITLGLAMNGYIEPIPSIIEPIIALSIFYVALENILVQDIKPSRIAIVFLFGLVHGMGFASALTELGLPQSDFMTALLSFNIGVELGQVSVILLAWLLLGVWFSGKTWYQSRVVTPASLMIAALALYWTIERL